MVVLFCRKVCTVEYASARFFFPPPPQWRFDRFIETQRFRVRLCEALGGAQLSKRASFDAGCRGVVWTLINIFV